MRNTGKLDLQVFALDVVFGERIKFVRRGVSLYFLMGPAIASQLHALNTVKFEITEWLQMWKYVLRYKVRKLQTDPCQHFMLCEFSFEATESQQ